MIRLKPFLSVGALLLATGCLFAQQTVILSVSPGAASTVDARYNLNVVRPLDSAGNTQLVCFPDSPSLQSFLSLAAADPQIISAEVEQRTRINESDDHSIAQNSVVAQTVDPLVVGSSDQVSYFGAAVRRGYLEQPGAALIRIADAHASFGGGNGLVAVIDTGVDQTHPVLQNVFVPGYDFLTNSPGIPDDLSTVSQSTVALLDQISQPVIASSQTPFVLNQSTVALLDQSTVALLDQSTVALLDSTTLPAAFGHATMVSGLIHLVAPGAQIMPLRAFSSDGTGNLSDIVNAIYYATDHGASVINMSFSSPADSAALDAAIHYASIHHVICVASAGNLGRNIKVYPASIRGSIAVGSTNKADLRSVFSNYGDGQSRTAAPGEALITSYPQGNYAGVWGTSFSAALLSGAAVLAQSINPRMDQDDLMEALEHGHRLAHSQGLGEARLDVLALLQSVSAVPAGDSEEDR